MYKKFSVLLLLLAAPSMAAAAAIETPPAARQRDYQKTLTKENIQFLKDLCRLIEAKGFKNVRVIPQMFVVTATGPDGKPATMLVDSNTLKTFAFDNPLPDLDAYSKPDERLPELR
jgi:hypothetical protein